MKYTTLAVLMLISVVAGVIPSSLLAAFMDQETIITLRELSIALFIPCLLATLAIGIVYGLQFLKEFSQLIKTMEEHDID